MADTTSKAINYLNSQFSNDINKLNDSRILLKNVERERKQIQNRLSFATTEVPGQLESAVAQAEKCTHTISEFNNTKEELSGDVCNQSSDVGDVTKILAHLTSQIKELEKYSSYLRCINRINQLSSEIQSALTVGASDRAVSHYTSLLDLARKLQASSCANLITFINNTLLFWFNILKDKFASEFETVLTAWRWPFIVTSAKPSKPLPNQAELKEKLPSLFTNLLALQLPSDLSTVNKSPHPVLGEKEVQPLPLPIHLMLKPLSKRFKFHFYGNKQTNSLDKPEWYMTQVLTWLKDHRDFLTERIQPLLKKTPHINAVMEFTRGLVLLSMEKMLADLPELLYDDQMFCHFVDELLAFHTELVETYGYPASPSQPNCLRVLTQEDCFEKWMRIERKFAMEKMDSMLSDSHAWQSLYEELDRDIDELHVPQCGESFITLVLTMTDRYKNLPSSWHKCQFLAWQLEMLEEYRVRLVQVKAAETNHPLSQRFIAILNTVNYVIHVLKEWTELPFFMELQLYKRKSEEDSMYSAQGEVEAGADESLASAITASISKETLEARDVDNLEGSVFDQLLDLYDHLRREMLGDLIKYVVDDVKARSMPYRKDKWLALPSQKEYISLGLSTSACEMLMVLKDHLHHIQGLLAKPLFEETWKKVASGLNIFIYYNVILDNHFNDGGASQLQFDMMRNLFPLFGQFTQKPENYFKDVKEACILLTLPTGTARLLKEVLYQALHEANTDRNTKVTDPVATLHEVGVYKLALENCEWVLERRTDLK